MGKEIKVDESVQRYAEEFIPETIKINRFLMQLSTLYNDGFRNYQGEGRKEVEAYKDQVLNQINQLSNNYSSLSNNLISIVEAFMMADKDAKNNIEAFYTKIIESSKSE